MVALDFSCNDATLWIQHLQSYKSRILSLGNAKLATLDHFYTETLPSLLADRQPSPFVTRDELTKIMEWKLTRGKWRPRLLSFISSLDDEQVKTQSEKAFSALPNLKEAVNSLSVLKGVGPATASAVLAAVAPDIAPFMSDEAVIAVFGSVKDYSLKHYISFADKLLGKSKEMEKKPNISGLQLTPSNLERAMWSAAVEKKILEGLDGHHNNSKKKNDRGRDNSSNPKHKRSKKL